MLNSRRNVVSRVGLFRINFGMFPNVLCPMGRITRHDLPNIIYIYIFMSLYDIGRTSNSHTIADTGNNVNVLEL